MDPTIAYRALVTRDARYDGRLFVGVHTTSIYCRPICPARTPHADHVTFFPSAAAAQAAGFRPCLRCRPETAPETSAWHGTAATVSRGLALIAQGALDGDATVADLADRLGVGERQLRRLFDQHLGASPIAVAQTRRLLFAKQLVHDTDLPMTEIAIAAGFGSVRRFNETFSALYGRPPSALRRRRAEAADQGVTLRLRYRPPLDWATMTRLLGERAIPGLEAVEDGAWRRSVRLDGASGEVVVRHEPARAALRVTIRFPSVRALPELVARVRRVFDLGADIGAIDAHLAQDPALAPLVAARPGLRPPGAWDPFETAVRAILGQQVSVRAACTLAARLVALTTDGTHFPTPAVLATADLAGLAMPGARKRAIQGLAAAAVADPTLFAPRGTLDDTVAHLVALPGIGPWTAQVVAMRAGRDPDAFPASDLGILRALEGPDGRPTAAAGLARAEAWRPWRAYAAQHLWLAHTGG